jgi:hypothetical protein
LPLEDRDPVADFGGGLLGRGVREGAL